MKREIESTKIQKGMFSVVVPVYNSEKSLRILYERLSNIFKQIEVEFELILVDDSSSDDSYKVMNELYEEHSNVKIIQMAKNFGQHKAIMCGLGYVEGEYVVTMDDDLQHPPEEIPKLIEALKSHEEMDVIIGTYDSKKHNVIRNLGTKTMNRITSFIFNKDVNLKLTSFRLMRRFIADALVASKTVTPRIGTMLLQVSNRIMNVTVHHDERKFGRSGYSFKRLVKDLINNIINNSDFPLRFLGGFGLLCFIVSILGALYYIVRYFVVGVSVPGWTTLIVVLLLFFGLMLFAIGLLGRYMMRIMKASQGMPIYVERKVDL